MNLQRCLVMQTRSAISTSSVIHRLSSRHISNSCARSKTAKAKAQHGTQLRRETQSSKRNWPYNVSLSPRTSTNSLPSSSTNAQNGKELVPRPVADTGVNVDRRVPVPVRIIPQAEIDRKVRLTPRERLHIEVLTRQQPQRLQTVHGIDNKTYRERLQIYHVGAGREIPLSLLRVSALACIAFGTAIIIPSHIYAGTEFWKIAIITIGTFLPAVLIHWWTQPMVTRIFLALPLKARQSSKTAMEYAKNLPRDAELELKYLLPYGLEGTTKAKVSDFIPAKQERNLLKPATWFRSVTFRRVSKQESKRFEPREFYVWGKTMSGKKSKNTIPGIWEGLFDQLVQVRAENAMKWKKQIPT